MWAYKSYNDDAPPENEPRFPPPETAEKASSSWTSWYNKSKKVAAVGKLTGMLSSRRLRPARSVRSRKSQRSRRSSFVSSLFSNRRSDHDGRLDRIIDLLELLAEDKQLQNSTLSRTSSRRSKRSRRKDEGEGEDADGDMTDEDDGDYRKSRTSSSSSRRRVTKPSSSRSLSNGTLETIIDAGSRAALQNWRSGSSDGKKQGLKERFKSSAKAGTKAASKMGLRQMVHPSSSRRYRENSEDGSVESLEDKANPIISQLPALKAMGKDRLDEMLKAQTKNSAKNNVSSPSLATEDRKPSHSRFKQEMLHSPATSEDLDEDLLDGILPPIGRYDFNTKLERPSPAERRHAKQDSLPETKIEEREGKSRPLHFDPKTSSVQAFDWPDKEEISTSIGNRASKGKDRMVVTNDDSLVQDAPTTRQKSSSQRPKSKDSLDSEKLLRKLMQVSGKGDLNDMDEDDLRQLTKLARGHVPSPPETKIKKGEESSRRKEGNSREISHLPTSTTLDDTFGIAWPMTPSHEPSEDDFPPEYESPTTDTFRNIQPQHIARPDSLVLPQPESNVTEGPSAPVVRQETLLFNRVLATMHSCFDKSKDLAKKQQEYQGERLQPSTEQIILRLVGSWFMKQLPPLEKASELFSFADDDCMFGLLEGLVKMSSLLSHPVLQRKRWESDVYEHLQQEADSLQRCFLGVASVAVVKYLQQTSSELTRDMPRILDTCYDMLKTAPNDPSQVLAIIPKIRAQLRDAEREGRRKSLEADELLDILYELATEFSAGSASTSNSAETSSSTDEARKSRSYPDSSEQPTRNSVSAAMQEESNVDHFSKQQPLISSTTDTDNRRGLAADFFDAPSPGPEGFPSAILKELENKQAKSSQFHRGIDGEVTKARPKKESKPEWEKKSSSPGSRQNSPRRIVEQEGDSLLMAQKPETVTAEPIARRSQQTVQTDPEGRSSSSSSDDGYHSGLEAAPNLPIILRKKLEGKKRASPKLAIATKLGILGSLPKERSPVHEGRSRSGKGSRTSRSSLMEAIGKRVPGSYFPAADVLLETMEAGETTKSQPRLRSGPVTSKATIYTPVTASPLRASISVSPEASAKSKVKEELGVQRSTSTVSSPTGVLFSNPFSNDVDGSADIDLGPIPDVNAASPVADTVEITSLNTSLASPKSSLFQTIEETEDEMAFMTPMASPTTAQDLEDILEEMEDAQEEVTDTSDISDSDSIQSTEVLTSADIQAGVLNDRHMDDDDVIDGRTEPLTEAEKDLAAREPEALVPGPRGIVTSQDVRNHSISYNDFSYTYTGAVPRVEVTPGAIQNTQGEVIPIDDEVIHLKAGETLIDGTGRVWNSKGMIEPGRDDQGNAILYEVDIAQIKRANNGVMPAMMPWDDDELMSDSPGTPSYDPSNETESAYTPSSMDDSMLDTPRRRPSGLRRVSDGELSAIDRQLAANGFANGIPEEYEDDDEPLDDLEMQEEEDRINAEEEADMIRRSVDEQRKMGLIP